MDVTPENKPCDCECHTPGIDVMHCMPCCPYTYQKVEGRSQYQPTVDFVGMLMGNR